MSVDRAYYESPFVCHLIGLFAHYRGYDFASCIILFFSFFHSVLFSMTFPFIFLPPSMIRRSRDLTRFSPGIYPLPFFYPPRIPLSCYLFFLISQMQTDVAVVVLWRGQEMLTIA